MNLFFIVDIKETKALNTWSVFIGSQIEWSLAIWAALILSYKKSAVTSNNYFLHFFSFPFFSAAILDDPMECSRGERLAITLAKDSINRNSNRSTSGKLEVDIFELLRDSEYEMGETSK